MVSGMNYNAETGFDALVWGNINMLGSEINEIVLKIKLHHKTA